MSSVEAKHTLVPQYEQQYEEVCVCECVSVYGLYFAKPVCYFKLNLFDNSGKTRNTRHTGIALIQAETVECTQREDETQNELTW